MAKLTDQQKIVFLEKALEANTLTLSGLELLSKDRYSRQAIRTLIESNKEILLLIK